MMTASSEGARLDRLLRKGDPTLPAVTKFHWRPAFEGRLRGRHPTLYLDLGSSVPYPRNGTFTVYRFSVYGSLRPPIWGHRLATQGDSAFQHLFEPPRYPVLFSPPVPPQVSPGRTHPLPFDVPRSPLVE